MLDMKCYLTAIHRFQFTPNLDCFASIINCQQKTYASFKPDPYASFVNAFSINWCDFNCYIFPPFSLIARVLQKIRIDQATVMCVLPHWPTQAWWPLMHHMLLKEPMILPPSTQNLSLPNHEGEVHPLHKKLKLVLCLLSGNIIGLKV